MTVDYWSECITEAFEDAGIIASKEQIAIVAGWAEGAHDNYSMAHGYDCIPNPLKLENDELKRELKKEQSKVPCEICNTKGRIITQGPHHSGDSTCWKCNGEGRHLP